MKVHIAKLYTSNIDVIILLLTFDEMNTEFYRPNKPDIGK